MVTKHKKRQWNHKGALPVWNRRMAPLPPTTLWCSSQRQAGLLHDPATPRRWRNENVHSTVSGYPWRHYSQEQRVEITQMSIKRWMKKQDVLYTLDRKLLDHKMDEEWLSFSMETYWRHYANWKKPGRKGSHVVWSSSIKYPEQENSQRQKQIGRCQGLRTARG